MGYNGQTTAILHAARRRCCRTFWGMDTIDQIRQVHADFIRMVVRACHQPAEVATLEGVLSGAEQNGWTDAVRAVRQILGGRRDRELLSGLDEEDHAIISSILDGLRDPATLPEVSRPNPAAAAPGLATIIAAASRGDARALNGLATMGEQMSTTGGEMAELAGTFRRLVNGERDPDVLTDGMGAKSRNLMLAVLEELARLDRH